MANPIESYDVPEVPAHEYVRFCDGRRRDVQHVVAEPWPKDPSTFLGGQELHRLAGHQKHLGTDANQLVVNSANRFRGSLNLTCCYRRQ